MIKFAGGRTRLPLNWPDHFTQAYTPRVARKGSASIVGEEEARMSTTNPLERIVCFDNKITGATVI